MKRIFLIFGVIFSISHVSLSQDVVQWSSTFNAELSRVEIKAEIKDGWHLYSQNIDNSVGPVPTSFTFQSSDDYVLKGKVSEPVSVKKYDENFEATLDFFENEVVFIQNVDVYKDTKMDLVITFMVCNDVMCLPPIDKKYKVDLISKK